MRVRKQAFAIGVLVALVAIAAFASKTKTFNVTNAGTGIAVVAEVDCAQLTIYENAATPTTGFEVRSPATTDDAVVRPSGDRFTFVAGRGEMFAKGQTVGYVRLTDVAGPVAFAKEHHF